MSITRCSCARRGSPAVASLAWPSPPCRGVRARQAVVLRPAFPSGMRRKASPGRRRTASSWRFGLASSCAGASPTPDIRHAGRAPPARRRRGWWDARVLQRTMPRLLGHAQFLDAPHVRDDGRRTHGGGTCKSVVAKPSEREGRHRTSASRDGAATSGAFRRPVANTFPGSLRHGGGKRAVAGEGERHAALGQPSGQFLRRLPPARSTPFSGTGPTNATRKVPSGTPLGTEVARARAFGKRFQVDGVRHHAAALDAEVGKPRKGGRRHAAERVAACLNAPGRPVLVGFHDLVRKGVA